jgi:hypothetical protein
VTPLYPQKLALTSPTGGGRSVGIDRSWTKAMEFSLVYKDVGTEWHIFKFKVCNILLNKIPMPTFLYGSENWTLTASQRRRIEAAEMKLLRPPAGYGLYDYKTNDSIRRELQTDRLHTGQDR